MADLGIDYNAEQYEPLKSYEPIPANEYEAVIVESERKPTSAGTGERLSLTWLIISGEYEGRKVFDGLNLRNPNPKAVEISMRQLSAICHATGKLQIKDSAELHDTPCRIKVGVIPAGPDDKGVHREAKNEVKGYSPLQASGQPPMARPNPVAAPAARQPAMASTAPSTPTKKPWERR